MNIKTLPGMIQANVLNNPNLVAQYSKDESGVFQPTTFAQMYNEVIQYAAGLREIGIKRGDHVGFISDNRKEWLISSLALHCLGAVDVPRGCDTMAQELSYIISFGDCKTVIVENETQLAKILTQIEKISLVERIIIIDDNFDKTKHDLSGLSVFSYKEIMDKGNTLKSNGNDINKEIESEIELGKEDDLATLIFTSGTTGEPKGVMLSHKNILHVCKGAPIALGNRAKDIWLTVLPVWHSFERAVQYIALYVGGSIAYSKPIGKIMLADLQTIKPQYLTAVPRIWEALRAGVYRNVQSGSAVKRGIFNFFLMIGTAHEKLKNLLLGRTPQFTRRIVFFDMIVSFIPFLLLSPLRALGNVLVFKKIKAMLGGKLKTGVSGGAALPDAVDKFFAAASVPMLEGYGITETAPVLALRLYNHPVAGTIGPAFPGMKVELRDIETGKEVPPGKKGVLYAKGDQVMLGYYKKPEETAKVIDKDGWFCTGDIGIKTYKGEIKLTGRAKDTIVLLGGENVEPVPIENKIRESEYIDHAVVLGQDQKFLAALIVPNLEKLESYLKENAISYIDTENMTQLPEVKDLIQAEITGLVNQKTGFRGFEMIFRCYILPKPFEVGVELSGKQDYKRHYITDVYKNEIARMFSD